MKKVTLNQDHWFIKFYKFSVGLEYYHTPTKNGCKFFWTSLLSILLLPLTWWDVLWRKGINLLHKAFIGAASYVGFTFAYITLILLGYELFAYYPSKPEPAYLYPIFNMDEISTIATFTLFPLMGIAFFVALGIIIFLLALFFIALIPYLFSMVKDKIIQYYESKNEEEIEENKTEKDGNFIINFFRIIGNMIKKACPIIEWK